MAQNQLNFKINFDVNQSGIAYAKKSLEQLRNISKRDLEIVYHVDSSQVDRTFNEITRQSNIVEEALENAFNPRLNTINFQRFNQELQNSGTSINQIRSLCQGLGDVGNKAFTEMTVGITDVKYQTVQTTTLLDKMAASLRRNLTVFVSMNIINKVKGSINEAYGYVKNLDTSLNEIRIVTGKSADEMDRFAESANKAAAKLGKATTDYTKASTIFYQQGLSDEEVQARTEVTLKASNTTGEDTKKVADQLTSMWNGFNVGAEDAEKAVDIVAAVAKTTASNLDEMATAMSKVASLANSMGVSEEQLASQISTVISVTRQAPESVGTAFKTIYARIADIKAGSEDAEISLGNYSGQLAALGINVLDADGHLKDMGQTIEEVGASWKNYSKEQQVAIAGIMGGQRQVNQIRALFDNWDKYTQTMKVAAEAEGTLQEEQDIFMESSEGQLQKLRTNWEGVLDSILSSEDIIKVAKSLQPILESIEKIIDTFGGGIGILNGFLPILYQLVAPQISAGIAKIGMSFEASRNNAELARNEIEGLRTLLDNNFNTPGLESYQQQLNALIEDYARLRDTMTVSQRNEFRESLKSIIAHEGPEVIKVLNEINRQKNELSQKDTNLLDSSNLATLLNNNDNIGLNSTRQEILEISETLNNFIQNGVKPTEQEFDELAQRLRSTFGESDTVENFVQDWENSLKLLKSGIQDFRRNFATQLMSEDGFDTTFLDNLRAKFAEVFGEGSEEIERLDLLISQIGNNQDIKNELEQTDVRLSQIGEEINDIINQRRAATREAKAAVQEQINAIESELRAAKQNLSSYQEAYPGDTDVDNNILEEASDRLRAAQAEAGRLEELYRDLNELNTKLEEAEGSFQHRESVIKYTGIDYEGLVSQQNELRRESADIIRQQSELNTVLEGSEQEIANLAVTTDEAMNAEQNFNNVTGQMVGNLDAVVEDTTEVSESLQRLGNTGYETAQSINNINLSFREIDAQRLAQGITAIGQGFTTAVTGITQLKNLGQIWNNEDLELGEKLLRTLTSLGMVLTTSAMAINLFRNEQTRLAIAETANIVVQNIQTLAVRLYTRATNEAIISTATLKAMTVATFVAIAAIIAVVVVAIYAFVKATETSEKKLEKANKKLEEATNKYNELKRALEDYAQAEEGLSKLEKGTKEFTDAISDLNQKVLDLIATYPELRKYLTIGDSGEFKLSKEGLEEYVKLQEEALKQSQRETLAAGVTTWGDKEKQKRLSNKAAGGLFTQLNNNWYNNLFLKGLDLIGIQSEAKLAEDMERANLAYDRWLKQSQEADKKVLTGYLKSYEQFAETSASITAAVVEDVYNRNKQNGEKAKKELDDVVKMQEEAKKYEKRAKEWENKGFNFSDADIKASNFANLSLKDITDIFDMDRVELADLIGVDASDTDAINDFLLKITDAYTEIKNLPSVFQTSEWESIDLGIRQKFENIAGTIDDSFVSELAIGLKNLKESTKINIDEFTTDLANIDWTQGTTGLEEFREKYGELNTELENYIAEQIRWNTIAQSSSIAMQNLADAMGKVSQMKFGDTLSEKDYGELINKFKGLEKYFVKIGDKYTYMAKSSSQVTKEIKKSFDEQMNKMNQYHEKMKETNIDAIKLQKALEGLNTDIQHNPNLKNTSTVYMTKTNKEILKNQDLTDIISSETGIKYGELKNLLSMSEEELENSDNKDKREQLKGIYEILEKIQNWSITSADSLELQKQYIAAVITSEEELYQAVHEGKISWEAASQMRLYTREKELELTKQLIEKENELEKSRIESERKGIQDEITEAEEMMNKTEGEEYNKWLEKRNELREQDKRKLQEEIDLQNKELDNLTKQKNIIDILSDNSIITGADSSTDAQIKAGQLANRIAQGKKFTEEELEEWGINPQEYKDIILPIIEDIANKTYDIENANRELKNLYKEQAASAQEILEITKKTNEIAISRNQRELGKIQDRKAHASGQEYSRLREEEQQKKNEYSYLLGEQKIWTEDDIRKRKAELENKPWATFDASGNVSIQQVTNEKGEVIHPTNEELDRVKAYQDARKEALDLEYQIEDIHKEQYITIDKTANEQRAIANNQKEINKLEKEATYLTGDALLNNLKKQNELREKNAKLQAKQLADSKLELTEAQNTLQSIVGGKVKIDFDISGGVANIEEILEAFNGTEFAEEVQNWINKVNDCADATQELEEAFLDFAEKLDSNYDEENRIKGLERQKDVLETQRKNVEKGSPEYERYTKELQDLDNQIRDLRQRELEEYESNELEKAKTVLEDALKNVKLKNWQPDYDKNQVITNVEDLQKEISPEDWKKISEGNLSEEELTALIKKYGDIKTLQEAILDYNEKQNAALDQQNDIAKDNITKWDEKRELLKDTHDWTQKNLEEQKSILELEGSGLYGDDKITNLEKQADIQHQITEDAEKQVKDQEDYIKQLKAAGADESVIAQAETDLRDYKKNALEAEKKEQEEIKKILQEKVKIVEEEIKRETNAQHQLKNQLKEVDRALTKIKKDQEGLSGNALVAKMQEEVALQEQKKKILEQQLAIIKQQIQALIALYSTEFSKQFNVPISFVVDENGVANLDQIEAALSRVAPEQEALAREMANTWMSTLNSLAGNWSSLQSSIDSMSDSIDSLNKKMKETAEAEAFRVKEEKWYLEEQAIKRVEKELAKLQRIQKHLTGPALIKNLEQQQKLLEKQAEAQARKLSLMKGELQTMQAMLALQGVMFSEDGLIANYAEIAAQGNDKLTGYLKSYQSLYESIMDLEEGIQETFDKKLDLEYEKAAERLRMFNAKIDVELDLGKAKREWQNFKREFLNTLNGMQQLNDSLAEKAKQNLKDIMDISARETPMLTDHVNQIMNEIAVMQAGGWSDLYGDDQATALSDLANYRQQLQDSLSAVADKIKEVEESYLQQIQKIKGKFDEQLSNYEQIQSIIDHDMNLIKLLKGSEAYDQLTNYYDKSTKNYESEIQMLRNQVTYWKNLMDQAQPGSKEWEEFQSNWKDALSKLNSAVDSAIQNLMDKYENLINKILSDMEKKIAGGVKLDYLKQQWDWANDEADLYLDKISQEYNIQKLTYKYQEAANKINDPTQRAKVLKIMDQELSKLKEKDKLTKYDVERANKIYDLRMKELELEDASQNKTTMRLRRDAEGNYRYEYVADQDKVVELKQDILDMEEEIRQFDLSSLREKKEESIQILQEFINEARELTSMRREGEITEEEYEKRLEELKSHYEKMYNASAEAIDNISNNLVESTTQEMVDLDMITQTELDKMTKEAIDALVQDISPIYNDTVNDMIDRIAGAGGFTEITREAMESLVSVFYDFESELEAIELAAGISFDTIISGVDETIDEMQALIENNDELLTQYQEELEVIEGLIEELHNLQDAYTGVYNAAIDAVDAALELRQTYLDNQNYGDLNVAASGASGGSTAATASGSSGLTQAIRTGTNYQSKNNKNKQRYALTDTGEVINIGSDQKWQNYYQGTSYTTNTGLTMSNKEDDKRWRVGDRRNLNIIATGLDQDELMELYKNRGGQAGGAGLAIMATGGYTGEWGSEGKIAMLHEKELVLNKEDTANILQAVRQTRQGSMGFDSALVSVMSQIGDTVSAIYSVLLEKSASDMVSSAATAANISNTQANSVTNNINANFPNAGNMNEIKNALMSFSNYASQQTHLNKRINSATTANAYRQRF